MLQASDQDAGTRIDAFLAQRLQISRARAQKILETAKLNGEIVKAKTVVRANDCVEYTPETVVDETPVAYSAEEMARWPLDILYQDDDLLVLNKPRGLTVHPGAGETGATFVDVLRFHKIPLSSVGPAERAGIVHRLDKDTSGTIIVAKTDAAHWKLAAAFEARQIEKHYFALCCGVPPLKGRIEAPIGRHPAQRKKMAVVREGRPSQTEYEVTQKWAKFAALDVNLLTGRTHQIRVHLAYINHPVAGDGAYGGLHRAIESAPDDASRCAFEKLDGQALHARFLAFEHPISGERMEFEAPLPPEITAIIEALNAV